MKNRWGKRGGTSIITIDDQKLSVQERGCEENACQVSTRELARLLKTIARIDIHPDIR